MLQRSCEGTSFGSPSADGWSDTELRDLEPIPQAAETAARRAALSARFPGERLVVAAGNLKTRSNDTDYPFRASVEYAYLTGNQTEGGVLVLEPAGEGHQATIYLLPRSDRENGEFWLSGQGELWVGPARWAKTLIGISSEFGTPLSSSFNQKEGQHRPGVSTTGLLRSRVPVFRQTKWPHGHRRHGRLL